MANKNTNIHELRNQRDGLLAQATAATESGNQEDFAAHMATVADLNTQIQQAENQAALALEQSRFPAASQNQLATDETAVVDRAETLRNGGSVTYDIRDFAAELGLGVLNSTTLASGDIVKPTGASGTIRDGDIVISAIIDQVSAENLTGMGSYLVPYHVADMAAQGGSVSSTAGTTRTATDGTFKSAKLAPFEVTTTSFVDRNISKLSPADYEGKIRSMALRALRRKLNSFIVLGDGQTSPDMYGVLNAKNTDGDAICKTVDLTTIDENTLDTLIFAYGGDEELAGGGRLYLHKLDLKALGALRGTNEKKRLYTIAPDAKNPNIGTITDGGMIVPYTISDTIKPLSTAVAVTTGPIQTMFYGNPQNYLLGLFGQYSIRIDESVKAVERMIAILGDVMAGGNVVKHEGFVIATVPTKVTT